MSVHENGSKERPMANPKPRNLRPDAIDHKRSYTHERLGPDTDPPQGRCLHEGSMKTGGTKRDTKTPRPATTTKPQNAIEAVDKLKQAIDDLIEERDCYHEQLNEAQKEAKEWKRVADGLREDYGYMEYTTDKLKEKLREALKAIKQGRIAFDDGQDMTDWFVSTAELQATIESILAKQEGVTDECE